MNCQDYESLMILCIHGEIDTRDRRRLSKHMARCARCRLNYAELRQVWEVMDHWETPEPPADLVAGFRQRLESQSQNWPSTVLGKIESPHRWLSAHRLGWNVAGLALAAALVFGVFTVLFDQGTVEMPSSPSGSMAAKDTGLGSDTPIPSVLVADASRSSEARLISERPNLVPAGRKLPETGVLFDALGYKRSERKEQVHFAVDNVPADIAEINTKYYNTSFTSYEDPF